MNTLAPPRSRLLAALAFTLTCVGLIIYVWVSFGGSVPLAPGGYQVSALFHETGLLEPGADVRISGIDVGRVRAVSHRGTDSLVTLSINAPFAPIPADTRAILREKTLLGEAYVDLSSGSPHAPKLKDDATLGRAQVQPAQQLDQLLNAFDAPTRRNLVALLNGGAGALAGVGQPLNDALGNLAATAGPAAQLVQSLGAQAPTVGSLVHNLGTVLGAVGSRSADLQQLVGAADRVLSTTAGRNRRLTATIDALSPLLAALHRTLPALAHTVELGGPTVDKLLPAAPLLEPALRGVLKLSGPAQSLLVRLPKLADLATAAMPSIAAFTRGFTGAVPDLLSTAQNVAPMVTLMNDYQRELVGSMANVAAAFNGVGAADTSQAVGGVPAGQAHFGRVVPPLNDELPFGQTVAEPDDRHNGYLSPGGWDHWATGLLASDCANTKDKPSFLISQANVPCVATKGFKFNGLVQYYPHLTPARP